MGQIVELIGGARSGKSRRAQERAAALAGAHGGVVYIATAEAFDDEMRARIERHRSDRPAQWVTLEAPHALAAAFRAAAERRPAVVLLDCLTLWLSNRFLQKWERGWNAAAEAEVLSELAEVLSAAEAVTGTTLVVTNEVGFSVVPEHAMGRAFRDLAGRANQQLAQRAVEVELIVSGLSLRLK